MRNWYYFTWLSGDFNVEQHIHVLDLCSWIINDYPVRAYGMGGRQVRTGPDYGNIYDHHSVIYEYANGQKLFAYRTPSLARRSTFGVFTSGLP